MSVLYFLESIRVPFITQLMLLITHLGEETAFLAIALIVFWCLDKNRGYYIMSVGFAGILWNQFLKVLCKIPRPWVKDPDFNAVEDAIPEATGYSFPSGHSQSAVGVFGCMALTTRQKILRWVYIAIAVLVPFSRLYLGVHTPADVITGTFSAVALVFFFSFLNEGKHTKIVLWTLAGISVLFVLFVQLILDPSTMDADNYATGLETAYTMLGAILGLVVVYHVDEKWIHFDTNAIWWAQILKVLGGLVVVLGVKIGLKTPLNALMGDSFGRAVRYFLTVLAAGCLWPLSFRWFSKLGEKKDA